jgi:hypothetical protein
MFVALLAEAKNVVETNFITKNQNYDFNSR